LELVKQELLSPAPVRSTSNLDTLQRTFARILVIVLPKKKHRTVQLKFSSFPRMWCKTHMVPGVFNFGAINNVSSALYTKSFTPKIKVWGSCRTVLDILVKIKICLSRCIELQALCNIVQVATNNQFFRQKSSWISIVQVN